MPCEISHSGQPERRRLRAGTGAVRRLAAVFVVLALAGCGGGLLQRAGGPPNVVDQNPIAPRKADISLAQERQIGQRAHPFLVSAYGGEYKNGRVARMTRAIVNRLEAQTQKSDLQYQVTILNSPVVNAFALPGGYIYVTRGLLALASTEDELANVIAHEMAHVLARHAIERERATRSTLAQSRSLGALVGNRAASEAVLRNAKGYLAKFSRQQEYEADTIGLRLAAQAGYSPLASAAILSTMAKQSELNARRFFAEGDPAQVDFLSGHPAPPDRIAAIISQARNYSVKDTGTLEADRVAYIQAIDGTLYGDDPSEGFVRGRQFLHPGLRLTFTVPPGFRIDNRRDAVNAVSRDGGLIRFDGETIDAGSTLDDYLLRVWSNDVSISEQNRLEINGLPAITARARSRGWDFRLVAVRWSDTRIFRMLYATKALTPAKDRAFLGAAQTIRQLSVNEARAARPLKIVAHKVRPGETVRSLSAGLPQEDSPLDRFRVLNGLSEGQEVRPGMWVKLVRE